MILHQFFAQLPPRIQQSAIRQENLARSVRQNPRDPVRPLHKNSLQSVFTPEQEQCSGTHRIRFHAGKHSSEVRSLHESLEKRPEGMGFFPDAGTQLFLPDRVRLLIFMTIVQTFVNSIQDASRENRQPDGTHGGKPLRRHEGIFPPSEVFHAQPVHSPDNQCADSKPGSQGKQIHRPRRRQFRFQLIRKRQEKTLAGSSHAAVIEGVQRIREVQVLETIRCLAQFFANPVIIGDPALRYSIFKLVDRQRPDERRRIAEHRKQVVKIKHGDHSVIPDRLKF